MYNCRLQTSIYSNKKSYLFQFIVAFDVFIKLEKKKKTLSKNINFKMIDEREEC